MDEAGLLFRSYGERLHDYDPDWDYEIDEDPDPTLAKMAIEAARQVYAELRSRGVIGDWMYGFEVWAVHIETDHVAMYVGGTSSFPVVLLDLEKHHGYESQFVQSIKHELKHAEQQSIDPDTEGDEDEAEEDNELY
jgi:hypothetical protein